MKRNKLLLLLVVAVAIALVLLLAKVLSPDTDPAAKKAQPKLAIAESQPLSDLERDTYINTVQTLAAKNKDYERRLEELENAIDEGSISTDTSQADISELIDQKIASSEDSLLEQYKRQMENILSAVKPNQPGKGPKKPYRVKPTNPGPDLPLGADLPLGIGFDSLLNPGGITEPVTPTEMTEYQASQLPDIMITIQPFTTIAYTDDKQSPVPVTITGVPIRQQAGLVNPAVSDDGETIPFYTIPRNATLFSNTTLTWLLGVVPNTQGSVIDPIRFKVITGANNLASNGHYIRGIRDIVWSGIAIGNREMSCVRGEIHSVTFTFDDGTVYTQSSTRDGNNSTNSARKILGYISDTRGTPCLRGVLVTNAEDYLKDRIIAGGAAAAAEGYSETQSTTVLTDGGSTHTFFDGDEGKYIASKTFSGGLQELTDYLRDRLRNAVDIVALESGQDVVLHVEDAITIDYLTNGRKLDYASNIPRKRNATTSSFD